MSTPRRSRGRARRRRPLRNALLLGLGGALIFLLGLGLGRALAENDVRRDVRTQVRTLDPLPLPPASRTTVTVTVTR